MATDFWNKNIHPVTGYENYLRGKSSVVNYVKNKDFNHDLYIETKELISKYNIRADKLGKMILDAGFHRIRCNNKKWVNRDFEIHLKDNL